MAEESEVVIRIKNEQITNANVSDNQKIDSSDVIGSKKTEVANSSVKSAFVMSQIQKAGKSLASMGVDMVMYRVNRNLTLTDNYLAQQDMTIALNIISTASGAAMSIVGGAMVAGPWGAAIAAVVETTRIGINIFKNYDQEYLQIKAMDAQLDFSRQRAGYALTAGSRGTNR